MKKITICEKEYDVSCNAYTRLQYKTIFGRGIFKDIQVLQEFSIDQEKMRKELKSRNFSDKEIETELSLSLMPKLDDFIDVIERMAYILIYTANKDIGTFEEWLGSIEKINLSDKWVSEVTEIAVNSFC